jgi:hypothetical protein
MRRRLDRSLRLCRPQRRQIKAVDGSCRRRCIRENSFSMSNGTIKNFVNTAFNTSFDANIGKLDGLSGFSVNWTGPSADIFAIHFGGKGGGNELLIDLSANTSNFSFSMTGTQHELSSIQGFGNGSVSQAPLPAALPLFATGLGGIGLFAWWRKRRARSNLANA